MRQFLADPRGKQARHRPVVAGRVRRAQTQVPAAGGTGRGAVLLCPIRGQRRVRCGQHAYPGSPGRRPLGTQRHQDVDQQRRGIAVLHSHGRHRSGQGRTRDLGVRGGGNRSGRELRRAGKEARHQGLPHPKRHLRRRPRPRRPGSSVPKAPVSARRSPPWTTPGSPSRPRLSASPRAPWTTRSATSSSENNSAVRSPTSRACSCGSAAAGETVTVAVRAWDSTVRVEVTDRSGPGVPELRPAGRDAEGGRGLQLVAGSRRGGDGGGGVQGGQ